jgi:hypothetical protein
MLVIQLVEKDVLELAQSSIRLSRNRNGLALILCCMDFD